MFFLLEAIRDVGAVPGVVERLGKLAGRPAPADDEFWTDSDEEEGENELAGASDLVNSPLLSLALREVIRSLLVGNDFS